MERLQDAIKRARQERQGNIGRSSGLIPDKARQVVPSQGLVPKGTALVPTDSPVNEVVPDFIEYTQTRQVQLNPSTLERNRVIANRRDDDRVEAYRQLRTQVIHTLNRNNWNSLAITSPLRDAGKSLTAVNLAISLAQEVDHTVILVDLDLSQPSVHETLGIEVTAGLVDVIDGRVPVSEALINPGIQRLVVLPGQPLVEYSSELLTSPAMKDLLLDINTRYKSRIVIFDLPPLLRNDDALKFTPYADATLMVVEAGANTPEEIERSMHLMQNANLVGTILNKAKH